MSKTILPAARRRLSRLETVEHDPAIEDAYERREFGSGWKDLDSDGQNERAEILVRFHRKRGGILFFADDDEERVVAGLWLCRFTGQLFTQAADLDIDHMVPLKAAWLAGAHAWTKERREQYANGFGIRSRKRSWLLPVSSSANRSKGARGPDEWLPSRVDYHARYAALWIRIKSYWSLSVTAEERAALEELIDERHEDTA